ncbi:MAG: hypothetical protein WD404_06885, partial [Solirubrobacterales bacterium]
QPRSRTAAQPGGEKPSAHPRPLPGDRTRGWEVPSLATWLLLAGLVLVLLITNRADAVVRDPDRVAAWLIATLFVLIPAALLWLRSRGAPREALLGAVVILVVGIVAAGGNIQNDYLRDRFGPASGIPGFQLNSSYTWARDVEDARVGLAGTTAGFLSYGFYGPDLSNHVRYLGVEGPHGAFNAIPSCAEFRAAVNEVELDYLVTAPFLNFIQPSVPIPSPEAGWLRGEPAVAPVDSEGPVTVWRIDGHLDPSSCRDEARIVPQQPD